MQIATLNDCNRAHLKVITQTITNGRGNSGNGAGVRELLVGRQRVRIDRNTIGDAIEDAIAMGTLLRIGRHPSVGGGDPVSGAGTGVGVEEGNGRRGRRDDDLGLGCCGRGWRRKEGRGRGAEEGR